MSKLNDDWLKRICELISTKRWDLEIYWSDFGQAIKNFCEDEAVGYKIWTQYTPEEVESAKPLWKDLGNDITIRTLAWYALKDNRGKFFDLMKEYDWSDEDVINWLYYAKDQDKLYRFNSRLHKWCIVEESDKDSAFIKERVDIRNTQLKMIPFANGVLQLTSKNQLFRTGRPEDFILKPFQVEYDQQLNNDNPKVVELQSLLPEDKWKEIARILTPSLRNYQIHSIEDNCKLFLRIFHPDKCTLEKTDEDCFVKIQNSSTTRVSKIKISIELKTDPTFLAWLLTRFV